jgi:hypothetical protein
LKKFPYGSFIYVGGDIKTVKEFFMKNTIKWLGVIALIAAIGFSMAACSKATPDTDFRYEPSGDGKGMVITGYIGKNVNVVIPAKIQKLPVVAVGGFYSTKIISVVIPTSVKEIRERAFSGQGLTSVIIPASVNKIGDNAFNGCGNLTSVVIPASVNKIGNYAFDGCGNLTSVTFKGKDVVIGNQSFKNCSNLDNLVFTSGTIKLLEYDGVLSIGKKRGETIYTEHYYYSIPTITRSWSGEVYRDYVFGFHSGASAFYGCDKLSAETISKLKTMGFFSPEEMYEIERKAERGDL